jgi:hypothetical protein
MLVNPSFCFDDPAAALAVGDIHSVVKTFLNGYHILELFKVAVVLFIFATVVHRRTFRCLTS